MVDFAKVKLRDPLFEIKSIELIDIIGRQWKANWSRQPELSIDFRGLLAGVYMVVIEGRSGERMEVKRLKR